MRACKNPICGKAAGAGGWCELCRAKRGAVSESVAYGRRHRELRLECLERDGWVCQKCQWTPAAARIRTDLKRFNVDLPPAITNGYLQREFSKTGRGLQAHHVIPVEDEPALRWRLDNLLTLCTKCHKRGMTSV